MAAPAESAGASPVPSRSAVGGAAAERAAAEGEIRGTIDGYARALETRDVDAASAFYPSLDRQGLGRSFRFIRTQDLNFSSCEMVNLSDTRALARCAGTLVYTTTFESSSRVSKHQWLVTLEKQGSAWKIADLLASPLPVSPPR